MRNRAKNTDDASSTKSQPGGKSSGPFSGRYNPKFQSGAQHPSRTADGSLVSHKMWTRMVMVLCVSLIIYWSQGHDHVTIMAKQSEVISPKRFQNFLCAPSYKKQIVDAGNPGCAPAKCGRMVSDTVIDESDANQLLTLAKKGLSKGGGAGGASILDLHSGALSKGEGFVSIYQSFPKLFTEQDFDVYRSVKEKVKSAVGAHFGIDSNSLYLTHPTFFSRLDSKAPATAHDEYWHLHIDKETYPEFHYTSLLYLTDFDKDFRGGEFVFVDTNDRMNRTIQPRMGRVSMFTSGIENKHYVERVTEGTRYALTIGFSCDPKFAIPEPGSEGHEAFQQSKTSTE